MILVDKNILAIIFALKVSVSYFLPEHFDAQECFLILPGAKNLD
jgi:hypothetical protein